MSDTDFDTLSVSLNSSKTISERSLPPYTEQTINELVLLQESDDSDDNNSDDSDGDYSDSGSFQESNKQEEWSKDCKCTNCKCKDCKCNSKSITEHMCNAIDAFNISFITKINDFLVELREIGQTTFTLNEIIIVSVGSKLASDSLHYIVHNLDMYFEKYV
jgi:hypothetical protein